MGLAFVDVPWYHALMEVGVLRAHCDVCDEQIKRDRGHLWANTLPEGTQAADRVRCSYVSFQRQGREADGPLQRLHARLAPGNLGSAGPDERRVDSPSLADLPSEGGSAPARLKSKQKL